GGGMGEEAKAGRQPAPKDIDKRRARIQALVRDPTKTAQTRADIAREHVEAQEQAAQHRSTSATIDEGLLGWIGEQLANGLDRHWLDRNGPEWTLKKGASRFQHAVDMALRQWLEHEVTDGRRLTQAEVADKRAQLRATYELIEAKSAELLADVAEKKKKALEAGGLYVLGTERHESRRIDNQLRGRSGRQGDPGRSKFYLSLEDDL